MPNTATIPKGKIPFQLSFIHPLKNIGNGKSKLVNRSLYTKDYGFAQKVKAEIDAILANESRWSNLGEVLPITKSLWTLSSGDIQRHPVIVKNPFNFGPQTSLNGEKIQTSQQQIEFIEKYVQRGERIMQLNAIVAAKDSEIEELKALLKAAGKDAMIQPTPLKEAIETFFEHKCKAIRKKSTLQGWMNQFVEFTSNISMSELNCQHFISFLKQELKNESKNTNTCKEVSKLFVSFVKFTTKNSFNTYELTDWSKNLKGQSKHNNLWLDEKAFNSLYTEIKKSNTQIAALAKIQFYSGFRPEELTALRTKAVKKDENGIIRIDLQPIVENGVQVWEPKSNSGGLVEVQTKGIDAIEVLKANKNEYLFPNKDGKRWNPETFTDVYLAELRKAAKSLKWSEEIYSKLDSRTLRRSCGKEVLLKSNFNIELCAAVLRDDVKTVKKHYARIIPSDVKQPKR